MRRTALVARAHFAPLVLSAGVVLLAGYGAVASNAVRTSVLSALISAILVVGMYVFIGNSGVFSFGHIGFMAIGAYATAILVIPESTKSALFPSLPGITLPAHLAVAVGALVAALVAVLIGTPLMQLSGIVASLGTFAFLNITFNVASNWESVTGGSTGLAGVPRAATLPSTAAWAILAIVTAWLFQQTRLCLRLRGSRDDEDAARALGIGISWERLVSFVLSAAVTGVAGGLFALAFGTFNPSAFFVSATFLAIAMLVVGGRLSLTGAFTGAVLLSLLSLLLRQVEDGIALGIIRVPPVRGLQQVGVAVVLVVVLLIRPRGITNGVELTWNTVARMSAWVKARLRIGSSAEPARGDVRVAARPVWQSVGDWVRPHGSSRPSSTGSTTATTGDSGPLLAVSQLSGGYGELKAIRGIELSVDSGEVVALLGPNGAGKTTILRAILGFLHVTGGDILLDGRSILGMAPDRVARSGIGLVPEGRRILGSLTVAENLRLGAAARRSKEGIEADLESILDRFPVLRRYYRGSAGTLSGGEQQQLAVARALMARPRLLLLDEPSLGLAPVLTATVFGILGDLKREGVTMLIVEQNAELALELADRGYVLQTGRIVGHGSSDRLRADRDLADAYLGGLPGLDDGS
ncbi:MAG: ATP-binding cassette domain-containing protein [bacterium]|nr:ATP-binding cassette domain-containing protein [bacterium]MDE0287019.1 ATP-binding cassette domain-containing protein [bacterium]MDE0437272.1 ATP-binding cassette domain-containing protein [bacterium]